MNRFVMAALVGFCVSLGVRADGQGTETEIDGMKSRAPAAWKSQDPSGKERVYQFTIPKAEGDKDDAQLIIFFFGAGQGGGIEANIQRWKNMVKPAEGAKESDTYKTSDFKVGDVKVTMFEANGTYMFKKRAFDPEEKPEPRPDYRMVAVVFESKNGPYYIRMYGPQKTMEANRKGFEDWIKGFK
jgi:hypothetical protein